MRTWWPESCISRMAGRCSTKVGQSAEMISGHSTPLAMALATSAADCSAAGRPTRCHHGSTNSQISAWMAKYRSRTTSESRSRRRRDQVARRISSVSEDTAGSTGSVSIAASQPSR